MAIFRDSTDKALDGLRGLQAHRAKLAGKQITRQAELAELRKVSGEQILDGILSGTADGSRHRQVADLEGELRDLGAAQEALAGRIRAAILALAKERAAVPRAEAEKARGELAKHQAETQRLLGQLERHEGAQFALQAPLMPPPGVLSETQVWRAPKSHQLQAQISKFESNAAGIETAARNSLTRGSAEGATIDELLAMTSANPEVLSPLEHEIREWVAELDALPAHGSHGFAQWNVDDYHVRGEDGIRRIPEFPHYYRLEWDSNGRIDRTQSKSIRVTPRTTPKAIEKPAAA